MSAVLHQFAPYGPFASASPFCEKVYRAFAYKGVAIDISNTPPQNVAKVSPQTKKLPVVDVAGQRIGDSSEALAWLETNHPEPRLIPEDPRDAALVHMLEDYADEGIYPIAVYYRWMVDENFAPFRDKTFGSIPAPLRGAVVRMVRGKVRKQLDGQGVGRQTPATIDDRLREHVAAIGARVADGGWLVGDHLTTADLSVFCMLAPIAQGNVARAGAIVRASEPVMAWLRRVDAATRGPVHEKRPPMDLGA